MYDTKHTAITATLEEAIRSGRYRDKLPPLRALMQEFSVSMRTIDKAVKPLVRSGLITTGNQGSFINFIAGGRERYQTWGLLTPHQVSQDEWVGYANVQRYLAADNHFNTMLINCANPQLAAMENWTRLPVDGIVFGFDTVSAFRTEAVRRAGIPAVALHYVEPEYGIHSVSADHFGAIDKVVQRLTAVGYRRIALQLIHPITGLRHATAKWTAIQEKYGIAFSEYRYPVLKEFPETATHLRAHNDYLCQVTPPEAVICWHCHADWTLDYLKTRTGNHSILAISYLSTDQAPGNFLPLSCGDLVHRQWLRIAEVLNAALRDNSRLTIELLPFDPEFLDVPPPPGVSYHPSTVRFQAVDA